MVTVMIVKNSTKKIVAEFYVGGEYTWEAAENGIKHFCEENNVSRFDFARKYSVMIPYTSACKIVG